VAATLLLGTAGCNRSCLLPESPAAIAPDVTRTTAVRHTDGDTAVFRLETGAEEKVRFIGVDTLEIRGETADLGARAAEYTAQAIPVGRCVWLQTDADLRDRYGRLLAHVWTERPSSVSVAEARRSMLNARLLVDGYALVLIVPPNVTYAEEFLLLDAEAHDAGVGPWGLDSGPESELASGE